MLAIPTDTKTQSCFYRIKRSDNRYLYFDGYEGGEFCSLKWDNYEFTNYKKAKRIVEEQSVYFENYKKEYGWDLKVEIFVLKTTIKRVLLIEKKK